MEKVLDITYMGDEYICWKMEKPKTFRLIKSRNEDGIRKITHIADLNDFESVLEHMLFIVRGF